MRYMYSKCVSFVYCMFVLFMFLSAISFPVMFKECWFFYFKSVNTAAMLKKTVSPCRSSFTNCLFLFVFPICLFLFVFSYLSFPICLFLFVFSYLFFPICLSYLFFPICLFLFVFPYFLFLFVFSYLSFPICIFLFVFSYLFFPFCLFLFVFSYLFSPPKTVFGNWPLTNRLHRFRKILLFSRRY